VHDGDESLDYLYKKKKMITGLAHACFTVSDLNRALRFYRDGLGLKEAFDFMDENGRGYGVYYNR
jgi:catechol 2,3-dioxygenase-like lactoylglutathione lyase family enzyme